ncbi:MAG: acyl-CoA dehydrogenase [Bacteroidetes bacterium]|nr:acyl-CoA dehydrogenase [Bacteroidota bacterium]
MMQHPSAFLPAGVADVLRAGSAVAEAARDLHPDQLRLIYEHQWWRMLAPGKPLTLPELVRLEEGIAWADGSVGWTVTLCSGAGWFAGFFPAGAYSGIFSDWRMCIAGSGAPSGEAFPAPGGYRISGKWDYASGAMHATAFTANCVIVSGDGQRQVRPFLFFPEEVVVHKTWNTIGLVATGSHSFEVGDRLVPADRCFAIEPAKAEDGDAVYQYPFLQLAEVTLAANLAGMAVHFLDCCEELFRKRERITATVQLEEGWSLLGELRWEFYRAVDDSWAGRTGFDAVSRTSRALVAGVRKVVDGLYPYGGLGAARPDAEINRVWRDLHTASQHSLLVD